MTLLHDLLHDLKYALRQLARSPFFTITASLSIAVGIYIAVGAFSGLNAVLFKPLPVPDADRIHHIYTSDYDGHDSRYGRSSYADYLSFAASDALEHTAASTHSHVPVLIPGREPAGQYISFVSSNFFTALRLPLLYGRGLSDGDAPEIVLSYAWWSRTFNGDRSVLGKTMRVNNQTVVIAGIAPEAFTGVGFGPPLAGWTHVSVLGEGEGDARADRRDRRFSVFGRLPAASDASTAASRLNAVAARLSAEFPDEWKDADKQGRIVSVLTHRESLAPPGAREELVIAVGLGILLVTFVLLLACTNVAALLIGRAAARQHEIAVRVSLGATRLRLIRQLLTESLLIAAAGTAISMLALLWTAAFIRARGYLDMFDLRMDWRIMLVAAATSVACAIMFGLAPARQSLKFDVRAGLGGTTTSRSGHRTRGVLIAAQVAASCLLVLLASSAVRAVRAYAAIDAGVSLDNIVAVSGQDDMFGRDSVKNAAYRRDLLAIIASTPGVLSSAPAGMFPLGNSSSSTALTLEDGSRQYVEINRVGSGFFTMMGVRAERGRVFDSGDTHDARVAVISQAFARAFAVPVGARIKLSQDRQVQVVGVVPDIAYHGTHDPEPMIYVPDESMPSWSAGILLRAAPGQEREVAKLVRARIRERFPDLVTPVVQPMHERVRDNMMPLQLAGSGALAVGAIELTLSGIGLYGLLMFALHSRRREIGIRLAIGSSASRASWDIMRDGLKYAVSGALAGIILCIPAAIGASKIIGVLPATDPVPFLATMAAVLSAVLLAAFMPARRAAAVDPASALRQD